MTNWLRRFKKKIRMLSTIFTAMIIIVLPLSAWSYELVFHSNVKDSVLYEWHILTKERVKGRIVNHKFPPMEAWETYIERGIEAVSYKEKQIFAPRDSLVYGCSLQFEKPVVCPPNKQIYLTGRIFTSGIKLLHVWFRVLPENVWMYDIIKPIKNGYQSFKVALNDDVKHPSIRISDIRFIGEKDDIDSHLIVGNIQISTQRTISWKEGERRPIPIVPSEGYKLFKYWPELLKEYGDLSTIKLSKTNLVQVWQLCQDLLERYPRYHLKKHVNRRDILDKHRSLLKQNLSLSEYYEKLNHILISLEDSHFKVQKKNKTKKKIHINDVIKFYRIGDRVVVAAVFDPKLQTLMMAGDEVIKIDNTPTEKYIQISSKSIHGSTKRVREKIAVERLLFRDSEEMISVTFKKPTGQVFSIHHTNNDSLKRIIPANFLTSKLHYKNLEGYAYLRIGNWYEKTWPFFYFHIDSLRESKGLILDLRSNTGGGLSSCQVLSCFLDKPSVMLVTEKKSKPEEYEPFVVNPDPFFTYKAPVVILVDSRTSCASELFISGMKKYYANCIILSQGPTSGAVAFVRSVSLPEGYQIFYPDLITYDAFGINLEGRGIEPDVYVDFTSYRDLAPYENKLVNVALEHLSRKLMFPKR